MVGEGCQGRPQHIFWGCGGFCRSCGPQDEVSVTLNQDQLASLARTGLDWNKLTWAYLNPQCP